MIKDPLKKVFATYFDTNCSVMIEYINEGIEFYDKNVIKKQLGDIISNKSITVNEFESLTCDYYDTQEELIERLKEIWVLLFNEVYPD